MGFVDGKKKYRSDAACECGHPFSEHATKASAALSGVPTGECMVYLVDAKTAPFWCTCAVFRPSGLTCFTEKDTPTSKPRYRTRTRTSYESTRDDKMVRYVKDKYGNTIADEYTMDPEKYEIDKSFDQEAKDYSESPAKKALDQVNQIARAKYGQINWPAPTTKPEKMAPREWAKPETPKSVTWDRKWEKIRQYGQKADFFVVDDVEVERRAVDRSKKGKKGSTKLPVAPKLDKLNLTRVPLASDDEL